MEGLLLHFASEQNKKSLHLKILQSVSSYQIHLVDTKESVQHDHQDKWCQCTFVQTMDMKLYKRWTYDLEQNNLVRVKKASYLVL